MAENLINQIQKTLKQAGAGVKDVADKAAIGVKDIAEKTAAGATAAAEKASDVAKDVGWFATGVADAAGTAVSGAIEKAKQEQQKKKEINFKSVDALQQVVNVVNEASAAVADKNRTIQQSAIPDVLAGVIGAGIGGVGSFALLYGLGTVGLSAAGITSGLAAAGAIVGGGMVAGVFVLAAPVAVLAGAGILTASKLKSKQLCQERERLYKEALSKHEAIIQALKDESDANKDRLDYLQSINILLQQAIKELKEDIDLVAVES